MHILTERLLDNAFNRLPFRGRLLFFVLGLLLGSGGLTAVLLQWRGAAAEEIQEWRAPRQTSKRCSKRFPKLKEHTKYQTSYSNFKKPVELQHAIQTCNSLHFVVNSIDKQ